MICVAALPFLILSWPILLLARFGLTLRFNKFAQQFVSILGLIFLQFLGYFMQLKSLIKPFMKLLVGSATGKNSFEGLVHERVRGIGIMHFLLYFVNDFYVIWCLI